MDLITLLAIAGAAGWIFANRNLKKIEAEKQAEEKALVLHREAEIAERKAEEQRRAEEAKRYAPVYEARNRMEVSIDIDIQKLVVIASKSGGRISAKELEDAFDQVLRK